MFTYRTVSQLSFSIRFNYKVFYFMRFPKISEIKNSGRERVNSNLVSKFRILP